MSNESTRGNLLFVIAAMVMVMIAIVGIWVDLPVHADPPLATMMKATIWNNHTVTYYYGVDVIVIEKQSRRGNVINDIRLGKESAVALRDFLNYVFPVDTPDTE